MAAKKPGVNQLGHSPFSKVKLEGPKRHHDFHGNTDSVPGKKSPTPSEHWERHYSMSAVRDTKDLAGTEWNPKLAKDRTCTHTKVNEQDH